MGRRRLPLVLDSWRHVVCLVAGVFVRGASPCVQQLWSERLAPDLMYRHAAPGGKTCLSGGTRGALGRSGCGGRHHAHILLTCLAFPHPPARCPPAGPCWLCEV